MIKHRTHTCAVITHANFYDRNVESYERAEQESDGFASVSNPLILDDSSITHALIRRIGLNFGSSIKGLDAGCGPFASDMKIFTDVGKYEMFGFDGSSMAVKRNQELFGFDDEHMQRILLPSVLPFSSEMFDFVQSRAVIQHMSSWRDVRSILREMDRVLRKGGIFSLIFKHGTHERFITVYDRNYDEYRKFMVFDPFTILDFMTNDLHYELIEKSENDGYGGMMYYTNFQPVSHCILWFKKIGFEITLIYNLAVDENDLSLESAVVNDEHKYDGGGFLYSACSANIFRHSTSVFSKHEQKYEYLINRELNDSYLTHVHSIYSNSSTHCRSIWLQNSLSRKRFTFIPEIAPVFNSDDIRYILNTISTSDMIVISGLHSKAFPLEYYQLMKDRFPDKPLIVDAQVLFREIQWDFSVRWNISLTTYDLPNIDLLKMGISELLQINDMITVDVPLMIIDGVFHQWIEDSVALLFAHLPFVQNFLITMTGTLIHCSLVEYGTVQCHNSSFVNGNGNHRSGRGDVALMAYGILHYLHEFSVQKSLYVLADILEYSMEAEGPLCQQILV